MIEYSDDPALLEFTARLAQVGGWELDLQSGIVAWTAQTFRIHELEPGQPLTLKEALSFYSEEERPKLEHAIQQAIEFGTPYDLELQLVTSRGNNRHTRSICQAVREDGRTTKLRGTFQDITERKETEIALIESEARYRDIFENNSAIKVLIAPATGAIVGANTAALKFYGYSLPEILKLNISDINIADKDAVQKRLREASTEKRLLAFQHRLASGEIRDVQVYAGPIKTNGEVLVHSIVFDITERKRAQESLARVQNLQSLGTLAGGIAHDFNNVLVAVFGNLSIARETVGPDHAAADALGRAEIAITRATGLSNQLLTFATGGHPIREKVSLTQLMTNVISFDLSGSNVLPVFTFQKELHGVHVDRAQLEQVFSNLTLNADDAMPEGGTLHVSANNALISNDDVPELQSGNYVVVTVRDQGIGIAPENTPRIFEPYFTTKLTGNGLGLATCFSIINKHKGHIESKSRVGVGTMFTIYLPASSHEDVCCEEPVVMVEQNTLRNRRALVLDDDHMVLDVVRLMLTSMGISVECSQRTDKAVDSYRDACRSGNVFDFAILDLTIPGGLGGADAVKRILAIDSDAVAICSSGYTNDPVMANFQQYGFKGIIAKPYTATELRKLVNSIPARSSAGSRQTQ